jgi:hypothetical protein
MVDEELDEAKVSTEDVNDDENIYLLSSKTKCRRNPTCKGCVHFYIEEEGNKTGTSNLGSHRQKLLNGKLQNMCQNPTIMLYSDLV